MPWYLRVSIDRFEFLLSFARYANCRETSYFRDQTNWSIAICLNESFNVTSSAKIELKTSLATLPSQKWQLLCEDNRSVLVAFQARLDSLKLAASPLNLYNVKPSNILSMVSLVITYVIVFIQFEWWCPCWNDIVLCLPELSSIVNKWRWITFWWVSRQPKLFSQPLNCNSSRNINLLIHINTKIMSYYLL